LLAHLPPYCSAADLHRALGPTPTTFKQWADAGLFPKPIRLGRSPRWVTSEVIEFLLRQEAQRA
jgi:predicted DNA-binding transcriptional regulator AlpA